MIAAAHHVAASSFWPTSLGGWAAVFAAVGSIVGTTIAYINHGKIQDVHVLVNGRFSQAIADIVELRKRSGLPARPADPRRKAAIDGMTAAEVIGAAEKLIAEYEDGRK